MCLLFFFLQAQLEKEALEDARYREQLEQERRDHELALRLAQETNDQLEEMSPQDNRRYVRTSSRTFVEMNSEKICYLCHVRNELHSVVHGKLMSY